MHPPAETAADTSLLGLPVEASWPTEHDRALSDGTPDELADAVVQPGSGEWCFDFRSAGARGYVGTAIGLLGAFVFDVLFTANVPVAVAVAGAPVWVAANAAMGTFRFASWARVEDGRLLMQTAVVRRTIPLGRVRTMSVNWFRVLVWVRWPAGTETVLSVPLPGLTRRATIDAGSRLRALIAAAPANTEPATTVMVWSAMTPYVIAAAGVQAGLVALRLLA